MREIKFNAVDEDTSEYVRYDRWLEKNYNEDNTKNENLSSFLEFYFGYKLLQYTGLKDKNGVEIYDGDILAGCNGSINGREWKWGNYVVEFYDNGLHNVPTKWGGEQNYDSTHWFEVIGNIYENPELTNEQVD